MDIDYVDVRDLSSLIPMQAEVRDGDFAVRRMADTNHNLVRIIDSKITDLNTNVKEFHAMPFQLPDVDEFLDDHFEMPPFTHEVIEEVTRRSEKAMRYTLFIFVN